MGSKWSSEAAAEADAPEFVPQTAEDDEEEEEEV